MSALSCDFCAADFMEGEACSQDCTCVDCEVTKDREPDGKTVFATLKQEAEGKGQHLHTSGGDPKCNICVALIGL